MPRTWSKILIGIIIAIVIIFLIGFLILAFSEYFPEDRENIQVEGESTKTLKIGETANIITYNLGYL